MSASPKTRVASRPMIRFNSDVYLSRTCHAINLKQKNGAQPELDCIASIFCDSDSKTLF